MRRNEPACAGSVRTRSIANEGTSGCSTPIRKPEDCRGLRIRTQMSDLHGEVFRALGFEPIKADIKEFVEQVGGDRFQAQDNPLTNIYNFGVHHHHRHITLTGHFFGGTLFICNAEQYRNWPQEVQQAVEAAAHEATLLQRRLAVSEDEEVLRKLDPRENEVVHLSPEERAAFVDAVRPVIARHRGEMDSKLLAAFGALLGPAGVFDAFLRAAILGGVMALAVAVWRGRLRETLYGTAMLVSTRSRAVAAVIEDPASNNRFPYAPAIACGAALVVLGW